MKSKGKGPANNGSTFGGQCAPSSGCFIADRLYSASRCQDSTFLFLLKQIGRFVGLRRKIRSFA